MAVNLERRSAFRWGLLIILLLYCCYYLCFVYGVFMEVPLRVRHLIKLLFVGLVYAAGWWGLRKDTAGWMMKIWHWAYALTIGLMLMMGAYDWWISRLSEGARSVWDSLQEPLVSPVLYIGIRLVRR